MQTIYVSLGAIILCSISIITLAKPFDDEKSFSDDNKLRCIDSNEGSDFDKNNPSTFSDYYRPRSRFEGSEKFSNRLSEYNEKRSISDEINDLASGSLQKRQVGVVYKDDKPIGILQPYQRSYRFIPVKEDGLYGINTNQIEDLSYNLPSITDVDKREINGMSLDPAQLDEIYPSILTNFKIVNKLDKKRNYDALTDENVRDLKATIRRLRSSNPHNTEQIEEELKNILDDMGLIEDEEAHGEKREVGVEQGDDENESLLESEAKTDNERTKRDDACINSDSGDAISRAVPEHNFLTSDDKRNEVKTDVFNRAGLNKRESADDSKRRKKRQKEEMPSAANQDSSDLVENLKDSGDLMISGNKSPLASSSEISIRDVNKESEKKSFEDEDSEYEKRVERQIQTKINSLKEEVKREIEALKKSQNDDDDDDTQRKKRQAVENLINEETDELNPVVNLDGDQKPLIRKRRATGKASNRKAPSVRTKRATNLSLGNRVKKRSEHPADVNRNQKNYKARSEEGDEGGELLGDDDFDVGTILKRQAHSTNEEYENLDRDADSLDEALYDRNKRSNSLSRNLDLYDNYFYNNYYYDNDRLKRQSADENGDFREKFIHDRFTPIKMRRLRSRRRINDNQVMANRPQQLSDMSDLDLFGALPKSYDGELSRYKRVRRK
ncbi:unnamed protein product [Tenebrio molitor]|nr:unnamed protein product [Tenebrio molitor]